MTQADTARLPRWLLGTGVIAVAMGVMNLTTYGFTIVAARLLGPSEYGALAALMGLLMVSSVASLGLQATGARRVSSAPDDWEHIESGVLAASYRFAVGLGLVALVGTPVVVATLRLDSWAPAVLLALAAVPLTVMGGQAGILQGERRWLGLAGIYIAMGLGRLGFGVGALLIRPETVAAMLGVALGAVVPTVVGWYALRHPDRLSLRRARPPRHPDESAPWARGGVLREVGHSSHMLLAFFALSSADVVIARAVLDDRQSGLYAGGLILAKAVLFLPQFVVVVAFPTMSAGVRRRVHLAALLVVLGIGLSATFGAWLFSDLAIVFIGGQAYVDLEPLLWAFAGVGTLLAMIQLMTYSVLARQHRRAVVVLWAGLVGLLAVVPFTDSVPFLLGCVAVVESAVLVVLLVSSLGKHLR